MPSSEIDQFAPNNVWASATPNGVEEDLTTPSGQTCRARKLSIEGMIEAGILADADALTATVSKHVRKVKGAKGKPDGSEVNEASFMKDGAAIRAMVTVLDKALPHIVVSPPIKLHYTTHKVNKTEITKMIPPEDREPGFVYTDQVGFEDKMYLFDWAAGGLASLMQFRQ